jgi:hypothetical protein
VDIPKGLVVALRFISLARSRYEETLQETASPPVGRRTLRLSQLPLAFKAGYSGAGEHRFRREAERAFRSEGEQQSERSDAGVMILPEVFGSRDVSNIPSQPAS